MSRRQRMEAGFEALGRSLARRPGPAIAACLALTAVLAWRLPELRVDNSEESLLHRDDPERIRYDRFRRQYARDDRIAILLRPARIFDPAFLEELRTLHREIEGEVPYVAGVTSLVNARNTRGEGDELIVEELMERWPEGPEALAELRDRVFANPLLVDVLIAADGRTTLLSVEPFTYSTRGPAVDALSGFDDAGAAPARRAAYLSEEEGREMVRALEAVLDRHRGPGLEMHVFGGPVFESGVFQSLQRDVFVFMGLSLLMEFVLLYAVFRRASGVILPLLVVTSATAAALGLMVWLDIPFSVTLNMLPAFLMVVGLCDSVHILTIVYRRLAEGDPREEAIAFALGHSGLAVVMTSVTTACGLLSFALAELAPIAQLGILAPAGVLLAMLNSLVLLPALLAVVPLARAAPPGAEATRRAVDRLLVRVGVAATQHPGRVVAAACAIVLIGLPGLLRVRFSHDGMVWFPDDAPLRVALAELDREFHGANALEVLVHTGRENGLHEPETLRRIERAMRHSETLQVAGQPVGRAVSLVDVIKETHRALHENRAEFYALPDDRRLIAQELLLFENSGSDDLEDFADSGFSSARITIRTPWSDAMEYPPFLEEVDRSFRAILGPEIAFDLTGGAVLFSRVFRAVVFSMARSYAFALLVITPLMVLLIGNLRRGLVAMVPNLLPVYLALCLMGWSGIPLDASTLLIGGVVIGLAVDDTIHFMHKFGRYYEDLGDVEAAVRETLSTTGSALFFTSLVLTLGFAVLLAGSMRNTAWFGLLAGFGTVVAFVGDVVLAPALMQLVTRREGRPGKGDLPFPAAPRRAIRALPGDGHG